MTHSNANETITLLEGARSIVTNNQPLFHIPELARNSSYDILGQDGSSYPYGSTVIEYPSLYNINNNTTSTTVVKDETIIILDRLKELTQKTIHLEV